MSLNGFPVFSFRIPLVEWKSVSQPREDRRHPSITEMESDMSGRMGGLRGGDQSFSKKQQGA